MPRFIRLIFVFLAIIFFLVIGLKVSGNGHLLSAVRSTYAVGKAGPSIHDIKYFKHREVMKGTSHKWEDKKEESVALLDTERTVLENYRTCAFLVIRKGEVIAEEYWGECWEQSRTNSFSMAKSVVAMLIGCAIDDGLIGSVDDKASQYIEELKGTDKEAITIKQMLQMTSGIGWGESYNSPTGYMAKVYYGDDIVEETLSYPLLDEPGSHFAYQGGNTLILSFIISRVTGRSVSEYASQKLWKPMGATQPAFWTADESSGAERAYCCLYSNARDFARFGQLILCDGNWNGKQLISPNYMEAMETPVTLSNGNEVPYYGYQLWMDEIADMEVTYMRGILGQYVFVVPEMEMVVVRLGHERSSELKGHSPVDAHQFVEIAKRMAS